ncbi:MAG: N-acetylmuramoyl-L-alanine amidase family protein [Solirubrobacterales bacterium]
MVTGLGTFRRLAALAAIVSLAALFVALTPAAATARTTVGAMRLGVHPDGMTRFVMDLSDQMDFTVATEADPYRVVIDTPAVAWTTDAAIHPAGSISGLRYEDAHGGGRIVLTLKEPAAVKSAFVIPPRDGQGWRFVMDLQQTTRAAFLAKARPATPAGKAPKGAAVAAEPPAPRPPPPHQAGADKPATIPAPISAAVSPAPVSQPPMSPVSQPIVVLSPAVQQAAPPAAVQAPAAAPVPVSMPAPVPAPRPAVVLKGGAMMSAAMPPPAERPLPTAVNAPVAAPVPAPVAEPPVTKVAATLHAPEPEAKPAPEPKAAPKDGKPVVVIDPGHGGVDPGAISVSGVYEKHITLAVARDLKDALEATGRYRAYLTRDRDVFIRLRDRVQLARQYNADLFISLHADAVQNPQIRGFSVYTLSQNASDAEAQALAEKENKADLIAGINLSHESADVANILIDLAQRETMNRSAGFATGIVDEVGRETTTLSNTHRFAGFAVLKAPDVPSVLIEMGYLSNEIEERQLRQAPFRAKLSKAITRAVDGFFLQGQKAKRP